MNDKTNLPKNIVNSIKRIIEYSLKEEGESYLECLSEDSGSDDLECGDYSTPEDIPTSEIDPFHIYYDLRVLQDFIEGENNVDSSDQETSN